MRTIYIECGGAKSEAEVWQRYVEATAPEGADLFGRNLNAFCDAVEHGGPGWPGAVKLIFKNSAALAALPSGSASSLLGQLQQIANEASQIQIELA